MTQTNQEFTPNKNLSALFDSRKTKELIHTCILFIFYKNLQNHLQLFEESHQTAL